MLKIHMKIHAMAIALLFLGIFSIGVGVGIIIEKNNKKPEQIQQIDQMYINIIFPKNEQELKKHILFNSCQRTLLQEMEKMHWFKNESNKSLTNKSLVRPPK